MMSSKIQLSIYIIEGLIIMFLVLNNKNHWTDNVKIIFALGIIFVLLGIIIFFWEITLK
ncbi:hypothetical protein [Eubacterium ventriosum]|jgi:hypothetical protein|uniref:hypothetical protein n=1 Tax=Eubacterium ventriosum TaxID=39496 RepID=UPI0015FD18B7|nr:hypothetical protein [uncultured Eubacterium sp.]